MLENEMRNLWKNVSAEEAMKLSKTVLIVRLDEKLIQMENAIKRRDRIEIAVAIVLIPVFAALVFLVPHIISKIGAGLGVAYCALVIYKLREVKRRKQPVDMTLPLKEQLIQSRIYYQAEMRLLDTVLYWYLIPPFISMGLFWAGITGSWVKYCILMTCASVLLLAIYKLNKDAVNKEFKPLIKRIDEALKQLEE